VAVEVGQTAEVVKHVAERDLELFAEVSLDTNPMHMDDEYAAGTRFGQRIAHGMLSAGLISAVLGTKLPGPGAIYVSQSLEFKAPVYIGDELIAKATVTELGEKRRVTLATEVSKADGTVVTEGVALLILPKETDA
jgi:3-hydroxybutyryl-CoA dehydratase